MSDRTRTSRREEGTESKFPSHQTSPLSPPAKERTRRVHQTVTTARDL